MTDVLELIFNTVATGAGSALGIWLTNKALIRSIEKAEKRLKAKRKRKVKT